MYRKSYCSKKETSSGAYLPGHQHETRVPVFTLQVYILVHDMWSVELM